MELNLFWRYQELKPRYFIKCENCRCDKLWLPSQHQNSKVDRAGWAGWGGDDSSPESKVGSKYIYEPLPSIDSIRLLKLEPGSEDDALRGTVEVSRLEAHPTYVALSWIWGDRKEDTPLMINDATVLIRPNLANALSAVRKRERQCYIWIDALCINQDDGFEKATQIRQMTETYRRAESVIVWLEAVHNGIRWQADRAYHRSSSKSPADTRGLMTEYNHCLDLHPMAEMFDMPRSTGWPEPLPMTVRPAWTLNIEDFAEYRSLLHKLFSTCNDDDFPMLSIALSTTLTSFRALRPAEVARVAALSMSIDMPLQTMDDLTRFLALRGLYQDAKTQYLEAMLRSKWSEVLYIDQQGCVRFARETMGFFFSQFPIRGVDTKHEIMANACLRELEFGAMVAEMDQNPNGNGCNSPCTISDLSLYTAQFWYLHYGLAQDLRPALSERLHRLLWGQLQTVSHPRLTDQVPPNAPCSFQCDSCTEGALAYCKERGFEVLENAYAQMKAMSPAKTPEYGAARKDQGLKHQSQGLSIAFSQCHIRSDIGRSLNYCRISSSQLLCPYALFNANWDSDGADSTASEADWLMVEQSNCES